MGICIAPEQSEQFSLRVLDGTGGTLKNINSIYPFLTKLWETLICDCTLGFLWVVWDCRVEVGRARVS